MTATGGFPAPGPQDGRPARDQPYPGPPPTGYAAQPQNPMLTAHKPGIVPLRPLMFGDILDGAFKAVRFNPKSMVGLSALVLGAFLIPSAALGVGLTHLAARSLVGLDADAKDFGEALLGLPPTLVQAFFSLLATTILSGLLIHVVGQAVLGRKPDLGQTWQSTRGRLVSLLVLTFLSVLFSILSAAVLIGPGLLLLFNDNPAAGAILLFLGSLGLIVVSFVVSTKIAFAAPAIVLEGHGVLAGLRRSFALTRGAFWRILGIMLVAGLIAGLVGMVLGLPVLVHRGHRRGRGRAGHRAHTDDPHLRLTPVRVALGGNHDTLRGGRDGTAVHRPPDAPRSPRRDLAPRGPDQPCAADLNDAS